MREAMGSVKARRSSTSLIVSKGTSASIESGQRKKLGASFLKSTPKISKLLGRHNLIELHAYLRTEEGQLEAANHGRSFLDSKGQTFLHRLCRLRPKVQMVYDLYEQCPEAIEDLDKEGRTPLHVAAMHGASRGVINLLLEFNADATIQQDSKGRTPLHLYCEHCSKPESCDPGDPKLPLVRGPLLEVVTSLCKAGPQAVNIEDDDDMTALEYCITSEADEDVVWTQYYDLVGVPVFAKPNFPCFIGVDFFHSTQFLVSFHATSSTSKTSDASKSKEAKKSSSSKLTGSADFLKSTPKISKLLSKSDVTALAKYIGTEEGKKEAAKHGRSFLDSKGQTFLHRLCRLRPKVQMVYDLYEQCPDAIEDLDKEGRTPLHVAAMHGASRGVIDLLLEFNAGATIQQDSKGRTPLHLYCEHCSKPESCDPGDPKLPLVRGPLLEVVTSLCKAGPQAINIEDGDDMTALEYCITSEADEDVVWTQYYDLVGVPVFAKPNFPCFVGVEFFHSTQFLVSFHATSSTSKTSDASKSKEAKKSSSSKRTGSADFLKSTPKISKLLSKSDVTALTKYIGTEEGKKEAAKHGKTFLDSKGQTFLHRLCRLRPRPQLVYDLMAQSPGAITEPDKVGRLPLHVAAMSGASRGVIDMLLEFHNPAAMVQDSKGRTPLHLYCEHCGKAESCDPGDPDLPLVKGPLLEVVESLVKAAPRSVNIEDGDDMTPIEYCIMAEADEDVVWALREKSTRVWEREKRDQRNERKEFAASAAGMGNISGPAAFGVGGHSQMLLGRRRSTGAGVRRSSGSMAGQPANHRSSFSRNTINHRVIVAR